MQPMRLLVLTVAFAAVVTAGVDGVLLRRANTAVANGPGESAYRSPGVPRIALVAPSRARPNQTVVVLGTNFSSNPKVVIAGKEVTPTRSTPVGLLFRVPAGLGTTSCQADVQLVVKTERGSSGPASLAIRERDPRLDARDDDLRTGRAVSLTGSALSGARFTLGDVPLTVKASSAAAATVIIPADHPLGSTVLSASNECGRDEAEVDVVAAPPEIVGLDPPSVAPSGILEVSTDVVDPALIQSATLDAVEFPASDPALFAIVPPREPMANVVIALRVPADTEPGWHKLRLSGPSGTSEQTPIEVVLPKTPVPPPPTLGCPSPTVPASGSMNVAAISLFAIPDLFRILYPAVAGADDETMPLGSANDTGPFRLSCHHDEAARLEWYYDFAGMKRDECRNVGTISGFELSCLKAEGCLSPGTIVSPDEGCRIRDGQERRANLRCHPLTGTYQLSSKSNEVKLTIDRGDGPEEYVGGWGHGREMLAPKTPSGDSILLLRSKRTGLQISIAQRLRRRGECP